VAVQYGDINNPLKVLVIVPSPVGGGTVWLDNAVPSLPYPDGTRHDPGKLFKVGNCVTVHYFQYSRVKSNLLYLFKGCLLNKKAAHKFAPLYF